MYHVIETQELPRYEYSDKAREALDRLREQHPDKAYTLVKQIADEPDTDDAFERLYALTIQLMDASGINPFNLQMKLTALDGQETEISAYNIIHQARAWKDGQP